MFKKDKTFFRENVLEQFVRNKMEKTFVDWYFISCQDGDESMFTKMILEYLDNDSLISSLNLFEICLLVELALKHGNAYHHSKAINLSKNLINN